MAKGNWTYESDIKNSLKCNFLLSTREILPSLEIAIKKPLSNIIIQTCKQNYFGDAKNCISINDKEIIYFPCQSVMKCFLFKNGNFNPACQKAGKFL